MLSVAEEIFLLALNDGEGNIPKSIAIPLRFTMGGAILAELFLSGKIRLNENKRVTVADETSCGHSQLDEAFEIIKGSCQSHPRKVSYLMNEITPRPKKFLKRLGMGLVHQGILQLEEKRYLWVIPYLVFPQHDASAKYWIKQQLRSMVLAGGVADSHAMIVLSLLRAGNMLDFVFTRDEIKGAKKRIDRILREASLGQELNIIPFFIS